MAREYEQHLLNREFGATRPGEWLCVLNWKGCGARDRRCLTDPPQWVTLLRSEKFGNIADNIMRLFGVLAVPTLSLADGSPLAAVLKQLVSTFQPEGMFRGRTGHLGPGPQHTRDSLSPC